MHPLRCFFRWVLLASVVLLVGCASQPTAQPAGSTPPASELACSLPTNCVSSTGKGNGNGDAAPLTYSGTTAEAMAALRATVESFPEATIERADDLSLETVFSTKIGFKDGVEFQIDPASRRIDYRSHSLAALIDWGKNRSRMKEFSQRFEARMPSNR